MTVPVQSARNTSASTASLVVTLGAASTVGNTLFAEVANNGGNVSGITGGGVTWLLAKQGGVTDGVDIWYGVVTGTPGTAITISLPAGSRVDANVFEWPGAWLFDQGGTTNGTSVTISSGSCTPSTNGQLIVAVGVVFQVISAGPSGGFVDQTQVVSGTFSMGIGYLEQVTAAAVSTTWTCTSGAWDGCIASFKAVVTGVPSSQGAIFG